MKQLLRSAAVLPWLLSALPFVHAADAPPAAADEELYLGFSALYAIPEAKYGRDDQGIGVQALVGKALTEQHWYAELQAYGKVLETDPDEVRGTDFYQWGLGADLVYAFGDRKRLTPFLLAGAGLVINDVYPNQHDGVDPFVNLGAGLVTGPLGRHGLRLRSEVRSIYNDFQSGVNDWQISLGIELPLGQPQQSAPAPVVASQPVPVSKPKPAPKAEAAAQLQQAKPQPASPAPAAPTESVTEAQPAAQNTAPAVAKAAPAMPALPAVGDSDRDGITDDCDICPHTLDGLKVNDEGCVKQRQSLLLPGVSFAKNSTQLSFSTRLALVDVIHALNGQPDMVVEIAGHTDSRGDADYNLSLSQRRADAVKQFLVEAGVPTHRVQAAGYGEFAPVADNLSAAGRERNRRVEFRILDY